MVSKRQHPSEWAGLLQWSLQYHDGTSEAAMNPMSDEDRAWLNEALSSGNLVVDEVARIEELVGALVRKSEELREQPGAVDEEVDEAVDELIDIVSQIDRATDIHRLGRFEPVIALLQTENAQIRTAACEVIGTCVQNNPEMQQVALDRRVLQYATHLAVFDESASVRTKAMFAVSCLIRNFPAAEAMFINEGDGLSILCRGVSPDPAAIIAPADGDHAPPAFPGEPSIPHRRKCLHLLYHILKSSPANIDACVSLGVVPLLAANGFSEDDIDLSETSLGLLHFIVSTSPAAYAAVTPELQSELQSRIDQIDEMSADEKDFHSIVASNATNLLARLEQSPPASRPIPTRAPAAVPAAVGSSAIATPTPNSSDAFVATSEWQELRPGQAVPPGLHVRLDMTTGKRFAKINDPNEKCLQLQSIVVKEGDNPVTVKK